MSGWCGRGVFKIGLITRIPLLGFWLIAFLGNCYAQDIRLVEREPYEAVLRGQVSFDDTGASPFPGTPYRTRIPYPGVIADTYFMGQIPILLGNDQMPYGANYGSPSGPLKEGIKRQRYSLLHVVSDPDQNADAFLVSQVGVPGVRSLPEFVGFGTITLKFTNRQYIFGFDLKPVPTLSTKRKSPVAKVQFYSIEGKLIGDPIILTAFATYTFITPDNSREVKGVEITNIGAIPFGIDLVVFELPLIIG